MVDLNNTIDEIKTSIQENLEKAKKSIIKFKDDMIEACPEPELELFLLFWVKEKDYDGINEKGNTLFSETAQTRMKNIKKASWYNPDIHKVHCPPIQTFNEIDTIIKNWTETYGGKDKIKTKEIGVFSHCGRDGPITYHGTNNPAFNIDYPSQLTLAGWETIDFNWKKNGTMAVLYGCNSYIFSQKLSLLNNFKKVTVWGQQDFSFPSMFPNYRYTTGARSMNFSWDLFNTYMVATKRGAVTIIGSHIITIPATPMAFYMNGVKVGESTQGIFNSH